MRIVKKRVVSLKRIFSERALLRIASSAKFIRRKRKIRVLSFVKSMLMASIRSQGSSLEYLSSIFYTEGIKVSRQAIHVKLRGPAVEFMKTLFNTLSSSFMETNQISRLTTNFTEIKIADSSEFHLNRKLKGMFEGTQNGPRYKLQALYSLLSSHLECEVTKVNRNDQGYRGYLDNIEAGNLLMFDLGYFCIASFKEITGKSNYFVSRVPRGIMVSTSGHGPIALDKLLTGTKEDTIDMQITLGKKDKLECRLMGRKLTGKNLEQRLDKIKRDSRRSGQPIRRELLETDYWSVYISNLDKTYSIDEIHNLYSLRWQVELLFKVMKSKLSMDEIKDVNPNKVQLIIYSKLILLIIALVLLRSFQQTEISLFKAVDYYKEKFEVILEGLIKGKWRKIKLCLLQIERFAKKSSRKNRLSSKQLCGFYTFFSSA